MQVRQEANSIPFLLLDCFGFVGGASTLWFPGGVGILQAYDPMSIPNVGFEERDIGIVIETRKTILYCGQEEEIFPRRCW